MQEENKTDDAKAAGQGGEKQAGAPEPAKAAADAGSGQSAPAGGAAGGPAAAGQAEAKAQADKADSKPKTSPKAEKLKQILARREEAFKRKLGEAGGSTKDPAVRLARKKLKRIQRKLNDELIRIGARKRPPRGKAAAKAEPEKKS